MLARLGLTFVVLAALSRLGIAEEEGFTPLLKGDDLSTFQLVGIGPDTMKIQDGVIHITGKPNGYFATKEGYKNYVLKFDWMYERPEGLEPGAKFNGNSGLLVHIVEPHKVWPKSIEVQLANSRRGQHLRDRGEIPGQEGRRPRRRRPSSPSASGTRRK